MKKLSFTEKNNFVLRHKSARYFSLDLDLFRRHFIIHRLNNDLARANAYTCERLDGQMLYTLLDAVAPEEILANRASTPPPPAQQEPVNGPGAVPAASLPVPPVPVIEKMQLLNRRLDELEGSESITREEVDDLRATVDDITASLDDLLASVEALEKKAFNKKKASRQNSPS